MASHHVVNGRWKKMEVTVDPDTAAFTASEAPVFSDCMGCMFIGQPNAVCRRACEIAVAAGGIDCDDRLPNGQSVIYVRDMTDPRQQDLFDGQAAPDPANTERNLCHAPAISNL